MPSVFGGAVITHALGGSAGREGAALQMGGGAASLVGKLFKLNDEEIKIATICGMSAFFSALFGTPLGAAVFTVEVLFSKRLSFKSIIPSLISSFSALIIAKGLLAHGESFPMAVPEISLDLIWKTAVLILASAIICVIWVWGLDYTKKIFCKYLKNEYLRIFVGGGLIIALTLIVGTTDYNGGGMNVVERIFSQSEVKYEAFALKILFTCITVAAGFKGGEIVPTFFIGATFGGTLALILGLPASFGAAIGMAVLFSGATNCPLAAALLCGEMFGFDGILYFAVATAGAYFLTGRKRLYNI